MTVEIQHVPEDRQTVQKIVEQPADGDVVEDKIEEGGRELFKVGRDIQVTKEQYIVRTSDARGKESRTYWIKQNDDGEWCVDKCRKNPNRGHPTVKKRGNLSTEAVRQAMREKHGIELVN